MGPKQQPENDKQKSLAKNKYKVTKPIQEMNEDKKSENSALIFNFGNEVIKEHAGSILGKYDD